MFGHVVNQYDSDCGENLMKIMFDDGTKMFQKNWEAGFMLISVFLQWNRWKSVWWFNWELHP